MRLGPRLKWTLVIIVIVCLGALLVWYFLQGRKEKEQAAKAPSRVSIQQGKSVIKLDQATQTRSGILTAPLEPMTYRAELQAYGMVLGPQNLADLRKNLLDLRKSLADLRSNLAAARAEVQKTRVRLDASQKQYERLKALHEDNRNISDKALEAGGVTWRSDEAGANAAQGRLEMSQEALHAGEESLNILQHAATQQWGNIITGWIFENSPAFMRLTQGKDVLIQITLPSGVRIPSTPESALVQTNSGRIIPANLISPSPRTNPQIQGMSFFYISLSQPDILPGMNLRAYLPVGQALQGVFIPDSAVVWWQGKTWAYIQKDSDQFVRREISTEMPVKEGWFVVGGLSTKDRIVTKGTALLLSEEFQTQIEAAE